MAGVMNAMWAVIILCIALLSAYFENIYWLMFALIAVIVWLGERIGKKYGP